jgi:hypothetical protein
VQESLQALRSTKDPAALPGRERLIDVQNRLVDLLEYLESSEGFSLAPQQRKRCAGQLKPTKRTAKNVRPLKKKAVKLQA